MEELAGEPLVKVKALVSLGAPVVKIELAKLPDLRRVSVVGVVALHGSLLALSLYKHIHNHNRSYIEMETRPA